MIDYNFIFFPLGHATQLTGSWSPLPRDWTGAPEVKVWSPNHWTASQFPFLKKRKKIYKEVFILFYTW